MRPWVLLGGAAVAFIAWRVLRNPYSYGGAPLQAGVDRDPHHLVPTFAADLEQLFKRMRGRGFNPLLWEGYRTPARAAELAKRGVGIVGSMHEYGLAADIVDGDTPQDMWAGRPGFWQALGEEARRLGLVWGGDWKKPDLSHVQGISVTAEAAWRQQFRPKVFPV